MPYQQPSSEEPVSPSSLKRAIPPSRGMGYLALSAVSGISNHAITATMILGNPSTRNSNLQSAIGNAIPSLGDRPRKATNERGSKRRRRDAKSRPTGQFIALEEERQQEGYPGEKAASPTSSSARRMTMVRKKPARACRDAMRFHEAVQREM